jgi:hypothetical protein
MEANYCMRFLKGLVAVMIKYFTKGSQNFELLVLAFTAQPTDYCKLQHCVYKLRLFLQFFNLGHFSILHFHFDPFFIAF